MVKIHSQESSKKIRTIQRSNSDYKGPVGQESTSYKGTTIYTYDAVYGILREIDHIQIFAIEIVLQSKVKRKSDAVKGQASFLVEVKSQSKYLAGQKFDRGRDRSTGYTEVPPPCIINSLA